MATRSSENKKKLNGKLRFCIFNDTTHEEIFVFRGSKFLTLLTVILAVILLTGSVILLISFTSLREFIPGYPSAESRRELIANAVKIDSLQNEVNLWRLQLANIQRITKGERPIHIDSLMNLSGNRDSLFAPNAEYAQGDSLLRAEVMAEEKFDLSANPHKIEQIEGLHFFTPVKGVITQVYSKADGHPFLDIAASENSPVYATLGGTVIHAGWDDENGYTVHIQHENNLVSIYKHNSKLLVGTGDKVEAGTPVALVGSTGTLSSGPHLHFELWHKGVPVDPDIYIKF